MASQAVFAYNANTVFLRRMAITGASRESVMKLAETTHPTAWKPSKTPSHSVLPVRRRTQYDAFGHITSEQNLADPTAQPVDHIFGFTGRERDEESDLNFYRARYYDPATGRFISQDPTGFEAGDANLYRYVGNGPTNATDPSGLWGEDVHQEQTAFWAWLVAGFTREAAQAIGEATNAVDSGKTGAMPWQIQGYHFSKPCQLSNKQLPTLKAFIAKHKLKRASLKDSRLVYFTRHLTAAVYFARPPRDNPEEAVRQLGLAIHPVQDWVAHGDHAWTNPGRVGSWHNWNSPQDEFGGPQHYPDDRTLDAVGGWCGRPEGQAIKTLKVNGGMAVRDYAIYEKGTKRLDLTRQLTLSALSIFKKEVASTGGPKSKAFFLGE